VILRHVGTQTQPPECAEFGARPELALIKAMDYQMKTRKASTVTGRILRRRQPRLCLRKSPRLLRLHSGIQTAHVSKALHPIEPGARQDRLQRRRQGVGPLDDSGGGVDEILADLDTGMRQTGRHGMAAH
jgi:hypothetical protein